MLAQERSARIAWARLSEPEEPTMAQWVATHGHVEALQLVRRGALGAGRLVVERSRAFDLEAEVETAARLGARLVVPGDVEWPEGLDDLARPPHCLWVSGAGSLAALMRRSVSVVGARAATAYGLDVATGLGHGLGSRGFTVVSGAAYGIDAAAHRGALAASAPTVAVLACSVDRDYPAAHRSLLARIRDDGCVVSEMPPGSAPLAKRFLARNRLIAALTKGTVVVEAGLRSGSLNTARCAEQLGRPVGAVPGPVTSMVSAGCHAIVREMWASLVTDAAEVAELVGDLGADLAPDRHVADPDEQWSPWDRSVHGWVPFRAPVSVDELVRRTDRPALAVMSALGRLEAAGAVRRTGSGWQKVPAAKPPASSHAQAALPGDSTRASPAEVCRRAETRPHTSTRSAVDGGSNRVGDGARGTVEG